MTLFARLVVAGTLAGLGICLLVALRAYRTEAAELQPQHRALSLPRAIPQLAALEEVSFSASGLHVRGWFQPGPHPATVILAHGSGADREQVLTQAAMLAGHGFGVLLFDGPGHGESEGRISIGSPEVLAMRAAIDLVASRREGGVVGAFGLSLGGCVALAAAAVDERLRAVAVDSTPADLEESLRLEYAAWGGVAYWPARLALWNAGIDLRALRPAEAASRLGARPLLVIGGGQDVVVPQAASKRLAQVAAGPCELWIVPRAGHGQPIALEPAEYERRLVGFFDRALRGAPAAGERAQPS